MRGYLIGSGWKDYQTSGQLCGIALPTGLQQAQKLPQPIFTPATKAEAGAHDENISFDEVAELIGGRAGRARCATSAFALYAFAAELRAPPRHHHRRHQVRVRPGRRRAA